MRVLVTGSREWPDQTALWTALDHAYENRASPTGIFMVVHGGAKGADRMAMAWVRGKRTDGALNVFHEMHQPHWRGPDGKFVKSAGHQRNQEMVDAGADLVLAFLHNDSPGTAGCIRAAQKARLLVKIHRIDDQEES